MKLPLTAISFRRGLALSILAAAALTPPLATADEATGLARGSGGGIGVEEHLRTFPPAPLAVRAEAIDDGAIIFWKPPPRPDASAELGYDPEIDTYRVYRMNAAFERTLIGETAGTWYLDTFPPTGAAPRYAVSAVQRSGQESDLSAEARLQMP